MAAELTYKAEGARVFKNPVRRVKEGGGLAITLGFPVCTMDEWVGDGAAESVAALLNRGDQFEHLVAALSAIKGTTFDGNAKELASAALARVEHLTLDDAEAA